MTTRLWQMAADGPSSSGGSSGDQAAIKWRSSGDQVEIKRRSGGDQAETRWGSSGDQVGIERRSSGAPHLEVPVLSARGYPLTIGRPINCVDLICVARQVFLQLLRPHLPNLDG